MSKPAPLVRRMGMSAMNKQGYVPANGVDYYYEIHGAGEPLLLLHGGLMTLDSLAPILGALAEMRQVIAVELHGHGRSSLGTREISLVDMGDDMATVLRALGITKADALGYSLGAGVAFRLAAQ